MHLCQNSLHISQLAVPTSSFTNLPQEVRTMPINISVAKTYIEQNLDQVRKAQQVASHLDCSLERLKRSFIRSEKLSISRFIRTSKVARMKLELASSNTPCKVICLDLGLREDVGARLFKRATGMTMENFRKATRQIPHVQADLQAKKEELAGHGPRLLLTESAIRQILSRKESKSAISASRRNNIMTQGPTS